MSGEILESVNGIVFGVWFLIGAALVFWMQAGFAMVEAGFTRAKNTGNILMKNLMDFCIGTIVFILIGFGLLLGEDVVGLIGRPGFDIFTSYATVGLRVSEEEEIVGLGACEHGLPSAYAGFSIMDVSNTMTMDINENTDLGQDSYVAASEAQKNAAVRVINAANTATGIYKVSIISRLSRYDQLKKAMNDIGVTGMTVTQVMGCGVQKGAGEKYRGVEMDATLLPKVKVEVIVGNIPVEKVVEAAKKALYTGHIGDGKIFVYNVDKVVKVRTGEEDLDALKDVE